MRPLALLGIVLLASCAAKKPWNNSVHAQVGVRQLGSEWEPVDDQTVLGLEWTGRPHESVLGMEVGGTYGKSDSSATFLSGETPVDGEIDLKMLEFYAGPRLTFDAGAARPYIGAGVSYLNAEGDFSAGEDLESVEDEAFAGYVRGGSDFLLGGHILLGIDLRYIFAADFEAGDVDLEGDSLALTGRIGWSF